MTHERFYRSLYRIRRVEEEIARVYPTDKIATYEWFLQVAASSIQGI